MAMGVDQHRGQSERVRRPRRLHDATEKTFDLAASFLTAFIIIEMHANTLRATILCASRRDPDNGTGNRQLGRVFHQRKKHENLVADAVITGCWNKNTAAAQMRHKCGIKR